MSVKIIVAGRVVSIFLRHSVYFIACYVDACQHCVSLMRLLDVSVHYTCSVY